MKAIRRDFLAADLRAALSNTGIGGVISVQARQTLEETEWLLAIAVREPIIRGVVGWVDLVSAQVDAMLERFAASRTMKGVRHVLQDEPDHQLMDDTAFNAGVGRLASYGLVYDVLVFERHLRHAIGFVSRHPNQVFVLNHAAKPRIRERVLDPWRGLMRELARRPNVYCKVSGMITEADWQHWTAADLLPYIDLVLESFTPRRMMFGSDWPVMLVASTYQRWHDTVATAIGKLSPDEQARIWGGTAAEAYRLER